ncbi:hypothetical protein A2U01_0104837, partial [Trifolium medium]|nr:hypothetical protein [Trifolium medium]
MEIFVDKGCKEKDMGDMNDCNRSFHNECTNSAQFPVLARRAICPARRA